MSRLEKTVVALVIALGIAALLDYSLNPGGSRVESAFRTVRDVAADQVARLTGRAPAADAEAPEPTPPPAPARAAVRPPAPAASETPPAITPSPPPSPVPVAVTPPALAPPPAPAPPTRDAYYLPGRNASWTTYELPFTSPVIIRSAGRIEAGPDASGPDGLASSTLEADLQRSSAESRRVLPSAPYLALIGRICSTRSCTDPFVIGSERVLCPSWLNATGTLQLWTNNYVRVQGETTLLNFTRSSGGYSFYVEQVAEAQCTTPSEQPAGLAMTNDAEVLASGEALRNPEFVISSSQSSWKPFFVPLGTPLRIRASGSMQPIGGAEATGPEGIVVPDVATWSYPGQRTIVVDAENRLFDRSLPYQALIGRLCGSAGCDQPFLVGTERVVCPSPGHDGRLELWVNHIIKRAGLLARQTPVTFDAFDLQQRRGSYRFEISRAPDAACGP